MPAMSTTTFLALSFVSLFLAVGSWFADDHLSRLAVAAVAIAISSSVMARRFYDRKRGSR